MRRNLAALLVAVICMGCNTRPDEPWLDRALEQETHLPPVDAGPAETAGADSVGVNKADAKVADPGPDVVRLVQKPLAEEQQRAASQPARQSRQRADGRATAITQAVSILRPVGNSDVSGTVHFEKVEEGIKVTGTVKNLKPGKHGFHVHEFGDLTDEAKGESAGGHFNPEGSEHGRPDDQERHAGDFGNIEAGPDGTATIDFVDPEISFQGNTSILGRAVVVHAGEDKFTQPVGDAGARVAFGVVGVAKGGDESK